MTEPRPAEADDERVFPEWVWDRLLPAEHFVCVEFRADGLRDLDAAGVQAEADRLHVMVGDLGFDYPTSYMRPGLGAGVGATATGDPAQAFFIAGQLLAAARTWRPDTSLSSIFVTPVRYTDDEAEEVITEQWGMPAHLLLAEVERLGPDAPLPRNFDHLTRVGDQ